MVKRDMLLFCVIVSVCLAIAAVATSTAGGRAGRRGDMRGMGRGVAAPAVRSVEILPDRHVIFLISAPQATSVRFTSADMMPNPKLE